MSGTRNFSRVDVCVLRNEQASQDYQLRPFFFMEPTVTGINYLDMLQLWLMPQLQEDSENFILQQGGATPHFHFDSVKKNGFGRRPWPACSFHSAQTATLLEFLVPLTNCFVCKWFCVVLGPKTPLNHHN
jgi:hypothetical protein